MHLSILNSNDTIGLMNNEFQNATEYEFIRKEKIYRFPAKHVANGIF